MLHQSDKHARVTGLLIDFDCAKTINGGVLVGSDRDLGNTDDELVDNEGLRAADQVTIADTQAGIGTVVDDEAGEQQGREIWTVSSFYTNKTCY